MSKNTTQSLERQLWSLESQVEVDGGSEEDHKEMDSLRARLSAAKDEARRNMTDQEREIGNEIAMGHGIDAYNDYMGY